MLPPSLTKLVDRRLIQSGVFLAIVGFSLNMADVPTLGAEPREVAAVSSVPPDHAAKMREGVELFRQQVRPVLLKSCVNCHGGKDTESEFDLTTREGLLKGGAEGKDKTVIAGDAKRSRLYKLITHADEPKMPEEAGKLSEAEIGHIARWIDLGAPYDKPLLDKTAAVPWTKTVLPPEAKKFWSLLPLHEATPPDVRRKAWVRTPVDNFVVAKLEAKQISPNDAASRRVLIRRASFDLLGLPPSPEEVETFVKDADPAAYEKLIDRLLSSPHYGERWARHWLDVARFAESHGFEHDYDRKHAYHFRDFVIRALNDDMPYNQFLRWQLAGDELAPSDPLAMMATGFLGAGVFPTQITANEVERTRYDAMDDMASTTGSAMLGMSIGCARCHDHKFDPIPQADYYRILATFTTAVRSEIDLPVGAPPDATIVAAYDRQFKQAVDALQQYENEKLRVRFDQWFAAQVERGKPGEDWDVLDIAQSTSRSGTEFARQPDHSLVAGGKSPPHEEYILTARTPLKGITSVRLEALTNDGLVQRGPGRATNGNFCLTHFSVTAAPIDSSTPDQPQALKNARATFQQKGLPVAAAIDNNPTTGWAVDFGGIGHDQQAAFDFERPVGFDSGTLLTFRLKFENNVHHSLGRVRLAVSTSPSPSLKSGTSAATEKLLQAVAAKGGAAKLDEAAKASLLALYREADSEWNRLHQAVNSLKSSPPKAAVTKVMVVSEGLQPMRHHTQGADFFQQTYFLSRGDSNQKEGEAEQGFMQVLMNAPEREKHWQVPRPKDARTSLRRTALANWITDNKDGAGHLAARVIVNRLWQHHFGRGIVATPNDFGKQGDPPTHPELLDYLAARLIADGWRLKPLHKLMMTSAVYMQSSQADDARAAVDPENVLLWRRSAARLDGEAIRDSLLKVSGLLDERMYGPGTLDENSTRRSIYFTVKRSQLTPMMQTFDAPEALVSQGARTTTTVAPQALLLMNAPLVRRAAESFAGKLAPAAARSPGEAVREGFQVVAGRTPTDTERDACLAFIESQQQSYQAAGQKDADKRALADFCQTLFALNEFVYVE